MSEILPLPCPLCGAKLIKAAGMKYWVHYASDGCLLEGRAVNDQSVDTWNRRAPLVPDADPGVLEQIRARLQMAVEHAEKHGDYVGINEIRGILGSDYWQHSQVREGFVMVPREPTKEMLDAAQNCRLYNEEDGADWRNSDATWRAMVAAAAETK